MSERLQRRVIVFARRLVRRILYKYEDSMKTAAHGSYLFLHKLINRTIRKYSGCVNVNDVYILSGVRTPIGRFQGKLASLNAVQLGAKVLGCAIQRAAICKEDVQEIILGICIQAGTGQGPARQIALTAGCSNSIISSSVNMLCSSGMKAAIFGCQTVSTMTQEVVAVVGAESMSNIPYMLRRKNLKLGNLCIPDLIFHDGIFDAYNQTDVTYYAEETAKEYRVTREEQDNYALRSYERAARALEEGVFAAEMIPVSMKDKGGAEVIVDEDEEIKNLKIEKFRNLPPETGKDGTITVGNSSRFNDGAAAMILASGNYVIKKGLTPLARVVSYADVALDPRKFCVSPSAVIPRALVKGNLAADCISLWEISETFSVTALLNTRLLNLDPERVNIHGGSVSLGHPFGMTGVRLLVHLSHVLQPGELGCASISQGAGAGLAFIIEKM